MICEKCDKEYKSVATLKKHSCKPVLPDEEGNQCTYCDKILRDKYSKKRHYTICKKKILFDQEQKEKEEKQKIIEYDEEKIQKCLTILKKDPKKVEELLNETSSTPSTPSVTNITNNVETINIQNNYITLNIDESKLTHIVQDVIMNFFRIEEKDNHDRDNNKFTYNLIKYIHCNPEVPENRNIFISDISRKVLIYKENNKWNKAIGIENVKSILRKIIDISEFKVLEVLSSLRINPDDAEDIDYFEERWTNLQDYTNSFDSVSDRISDILISELYNNKTKVIKN